MPTTIQQCHINGIYDKTRVMIKEKGYTIKERLYERNSPRPRTKATTAKVTAHSVTHTATPH